MNKWIGAVMAAAVLLAGTMVYAGGACCESKGDASKAEKMMGCSSDTLAKLKLTDEQKKKVDALKAECTKDGCTPAMHEKFTKAMKDILTDDQYTQWRSECAKMNKGGCPYMKKDEPKS